MNFLKRLFRKLDPDYETEALRVSEAKFRGLFDNMSSGVAIYEAADHGKNFIFRDFNDAGCRIEQVKREDVIGKRVTDVFPGIGEFGFLEVLQRVWKSGAPEVFPTKQYQDKRIAGWRENYVFKLPSGEVVAVYDDITERKRTEAVLERSTERFRRIYRSNMIGIAFWKPIIETFRSRDAQFELAEAAGAGVLAGVHGDCDWRTGDGAAAEHRAFRAGTDCGVAGCGGDLRVAGG